MHREHISEGLKNFIRKEIQTCFRLEVLLFLHRRRPKSASIEEVANELGFEHDIAQEQLAALGEIGILTSEDEFNYRYAPANERVGAMVTELAQAYPTQRVPILSLLLSERPDKIRVFAEAIKLLRQNH